MAPAPGNLIGNGVADVVVAVRGNNLDHDYAHRV
jgi:hypothetical protein